MSHPTPNEHPDADASGRRGGRPRAADDLRAPRREPSTTTEPAGPAPVGERSRRTSLARALLNRTLVR